MQPLQREKLFANHELLTLLWPLIIEQTLSVLVGMANVGPHYQLVVRRRNFMDNLEVKVELLNGDLLENYRVLEALQKSVHDRLKSVLGLETRVTLVEPKSLERFQGKAKRILDLRNQPEESSRL